MTPAIDKKEFNVHAAGKKTIGAALVTAAVAGLVAAAPVPTWSATPIVSGSPIKATGYHYIHLSNPTRTQVTDASGKWLATLTNGAREVDLVGPTRTFKEPSTTRATVTHNTWVRLLPKAYNGTVDTTWLRDELADRTPDVLATAFQYTAGAPTVYKNGLRISGDANYGPLNGPDPANRIENNDWNDYLGVTAHYPDGEVRPADPSRYGDIDCSGFVRTVFGFRLGYPLAYLPNKTPGALPRRAIMMYQSGPGVLLYTDPGKQQKDFSRLQIGDLVFFSANNGGPQISHVGIFLGKDNSGHYRFVSSRKVANGPTMGDVGGTSLLDGNGLYARTYRAARRI